MNPVTTDMKDMLVADTDLSLTFATNLFIGREPVKPDNCVTLYDTPGRGPSLTFDRDERYDYESFQVRIRNREYLVAFELANDIVDSLQGRANETWSNTYYALVRCMTLPHVLGWDDNNRVLVVINFETQRRR